MKSTAILLSAAFLAACATTPVGPVAPPPPSIPSTPLDMGDWRHATADAELSAFQNAVEHRYGAGLDLDGVTADLRRAQFTCNPNRDTVGNPPAQICRKTITEAGCTHTWQVHLYDTSGDAKLARTRGLYDRRCGGDGLLGGPS
ncbi:MAG TPA: hypothetical protein VG943_07665 [Caulobacterales bacterium]|nr:hypothetical protein [Caulobacterales bacterium]